MKICMVTYSFYESDTRIMQYAKTLAERGDSVDVIALRRNGSLAFEVLDGVSVYRIQPRNVNEKGKLDYLVRILRFLFSSAALLARKHLSGRYDVIHVHNVPDFLVFSAIVPKLLGARVILDIHDILPELYADKFSIPSDSAIFKMLVWVERLSCGFADHVIIANHLWRDRLIARSVDSERCTAVLNYPDPSIFYLRRQRTEDGTFLLIYPGSLNKLQGLDVAIRAFAKVADRMPEARFEIFGEGPAKASLIEMTEQLGLSGRVTFHDFLPTKDIAQVMADADVAVVPKRASSAFANEAMSTKIMEFMAMGVPVIASRTKIDTYYHDESRVEFFESENVNDLADSILRLRQDPPKRKQLADNGVEHARQNNWQEKSREYLALIDGAKTQHKRSAAPASMPGVLVNSVHHRDVDSN